MPVWDTGFGIHGGRRSSDSIPRHFLGDIRKLGEEAGLDFPAGGRGKHQLLAAGRFLCCYSEMPLVQLTVMRPTQSNKVVQAGLAAIGPVLYVMGINIS